LNDTSVCAKPNRASAEDSNPKAGDTQKHTELISAIKTLERDKRNSNSNSGRGVQVGLAEINTSELHPKQHPKRYSQTACIHFIT